MRPLPSTIWAAIVVVCSYASFQAGAIYSQAPRVGKTVVVEVGEAVIEPCDAFDALELELK